MTSPTVNAIEYLPIERLRPAPWNPNKMADKQFNRLVQSLQEDGFLEPILVAPMSAEMRRKYLTPEEDESEAPFYLIVGGHHRWEAGKLVGMTEIPCVIKTDWQEDDVKLANTRMNLLRGKIDPVKMTALYEEMVEKFGEELAQEQMGILDKNELKRLIVQVRDELPPELQKKMDEAQGEIQSVDDLSRILNELFSKHGDTIPLHYLIFTFGGKTHTWVDQDRPLFKKVEALRQFCYDHRYSLRDVLNFLLEGADDRLKTAAFTPVEAETHVAQALAGE